MHATYITSVLFTYGGHVSKIRVFDTVLRLLPQAFPAERDLFSDLEDALAGAIRIHQGKAKALAKKDRAAASKEVKRLVLLGLAFLAFRRWVNTAHVRPARDGRQLQTTRVARNRIPLPFMQESYSVGRRFRGARYPATTTPSEPTVLLMST